MRNIKTVKLQHNARKFSFDHVDYIVLYKCCSGFSLKFQFRLVSTLYNSFQYTVLVDIMLKINSFIPSIMRKTVYLPHKDFYTLVM